MRIAHNPETGEYVGYQNGTWQPLRIAQNQAGEKLYLGENGWTPLDVSAASTPDNPGKPERGTTGGVLTDAARGVGITARSVMEGLSDAVTFAPDLYAAAGNYLLPQNQKNADAIRNVIDDVDGLSDDDKENVMHLMDNGFDTVANIGTKVSDAISLPEARTDKEKLLAAGVRGVSGAASGLGIGKTIARQAPRLAKWLTTAPGTQLAGGGLSGVLSEEARQEGAGLGGQVAAGVVGAMTPSALIAGGRAAARTGAAGARALEALSDAGQRRIAAENIRSMATRPDDLLATLDKAELELVPGSKPTLGQVAGDPGLAVTEKGRASTSANRADYGERYKQQADARQDVLNDVAGTLESSRAARQESLNSMLKDLQAQQTAREAGVVGDVNGMKVAGIDLPVADNGAALADIYKQRYAAEKARTRAMYNSIDPDGTATFNLEPLRQSFDSVLERGQFAPALPGDIQRIVGQMDDAIANGRPATYRDLQNVRKQLRQRATDAAKTGDSDLARIAGNMQHSLDDWLDAIPEPGDAIMPKPGSKAYRAVENEARAALGPASDPFGVDLQYMRKLGINKDWLVNNIGAGAPAELNKMYPGLVRESGTFIPDVSAGSLQTKFARGDEIYDALKSYYPTYAGRNSAVARTVDDMLWANRIEPTGFTDAQAQAFKDAKFQRSQQGKLFEENFNQAMSRGQLRPDQVMGNYFKAGPAGDGAAKDFLRAFGDDAQAAQILQDHIASAFHQAVVKNGKLDAAAMRKWLQAHSAALENFPEVRQRLMRIAASQEAAERAAMNTRESIAAAPDGSARLGKLTIDDARVKDLVKSGAMTTAEAKRLQALQAAERATGTVKQVISTTPNVPPRLGKAPITDGLQDYLVNSGAMTAEDVKKLRAVQADVARRKRMDELGAVRGSPTAQNLATQAIMDTALGRSLGRNVNGLGSTPKGIMRNVLAGIFNKGAEVLYGRADANINRIIDDAFLDPTLAKELLKNYKPYTPKRTMGDIASTASKAAAVQSARNLLQLIANSDKRK